MTAGKPAPTRPLMVTKRMSLSSTDSPPILTPAAPSTVNKPLAPMPGHMSTPILINKTWVLPPKPKPGRKPALDTPPTKRKAQNREAQRAFRERRAAKVGELEEEMKKMEEEDAKEQEALREIIRSLETRVDDYKNKAEVWQEKLDEMQMAFERERQLRAQTDAELMLLRSGTGDETTEAIPLPSRTKRKDLNASQANSFSEVNGNADGNDIVEEIPITCGKCSNDSRCQCLEEAFEMSNLADEPSSSKRPHSPPSNKVENKRIRQASNIDEATEIDFTSQFSTSRPPPLATSSSTTSVAAIAPLDPCGFCSDGTPCICAEMAKEASRRPSVKPPVSQPIAPFKQDPQSGPPKNSNPCANGPGTCAQCLSDPASTLFCKTVAAANNLPSATSPYPSSLAPPPLPTLSQPPTTSTSTSIPTTTARLTCADAFTTLSRHPGFHAATNELNSWVPQLTAVPKQPQQQQQQQQNTGPSSRGVVGDWDGVVSAPRRTAFDIEAASVMSVLRFFDRRFGAESEGERRG